MLDPDTGALTIQSASVSGAQFSAQGTLELMRFIMKGAAPKMPIQGQAQSHAPIDDRPEIKARQERNLKALEDWAKASSTSYPKNK